jgi:acetyl esterase/lipase
LWFKHRYFRRKHAPRTAVAKVLCLALALGLTACAGSAGAVGMPLVSAILPPKYTVRIRWNLAYGPQPDEVLDLCLPQGASGPHPAVVIIHGGGWIQGDKRYFDGLCHALASRGFVAAAIDYRLALQYTWPAQLVDAQLAVRWLRAQAAQIGADPQRICAYGDSAGGQLAVFLGVLATSHPGDEANLLANESPHVSCVVDEFGPVNLAMLLTATPWGRGIGKALFGAPPAPDNVARYRDASPFYDVSPQSAPVLIIQGTRDMVVPPGQSRALQRALEQNHVPVQYISYAGGHEFNGLSQQQQAIITARAIAFLSAREHP